MEQLKKCPFCGGGAVVDQDEGWYWEWKAYCVKCNVSLGHFNTKNEAIAAWNTRKPLERIVERLGKKVNFVDTKIEQKIRLGHQTESDQQFMNGIIYAIKIVEEEMGRI